MADIPEAYGGMGVDKATDHDGQRGVAWGGSFAVTHGAQSGIGTLPIVYFGTPEQKRASTCRAWPPANCSAATR